MLARESEGARAPTNSLFGLIKRITSSHVFLRWVSRVALAGAVVVVLSGGWPESESDVLPTREWPKSVGLNLVEPIELLADLVVEELQHALAVHDSGGLLVLLTLAQVVLQLSF